MFLAQKYVVSKKSFTMSSLRPIQSKKMKGIGNVVIHTLIYSIVSLAIIPQVTVIYTSFKATRGAVFADGYSLESYQKIFSNLGTAISNTYLFGLIAVTIIIILSMLIAYLTIRRKSCITSIVDSMTMFPFIIPGSVLGITLLLAFNQKPILLSGTAFIMILSFVVRRLPYTLRSSSAILYQISPSMEEALLVWAIPVLKHFLK